MLKYCWSVIKKNGGMYFLALFIELVFYGGSLLCSGLIRRDLFYALENKETLFGFSITLMLILIGMLPILVNLGKQVNEYLITSSVTRFGNTMKQDLYRKSIELKIARKGRIGSTECINYYRGDVSILTKFIEQFIDLIPKVIMSVAALFILVNINALFTVISLIPIIVIVGLSKLLQNKITNYRNNARLATGSTVEYIGNVFNNIESFKVMPVKEMMYKKYKDVCSKRKTDQTKDKLLGAMLRAVSIGMMDIVLGVILLLIGLRFFSESFSIGDFTIFQSYFYFLTMLPGIIGNLFKSYIQAGISYRRLENVAGGQLASKIIDKRKGIKKVLCNGYQVTVRYETDTVVKDIRFPIKPSELVVISGKTGSGKTTIIRGLAGEWNEKVQVSFTKAQNTVKDSYLIPPVACYVPQKNYLFSDTLINNICMGKKENISLIHKILYQVDFENDLKTLEKGLYTLVGNNGAKLSGGQRKRIALARALYANPAVLLLDDFTAGLDVNTRDQIIDRLVLSKQYIIIASSNEEEIIQKANVHIDLDKGVI
ncbi:ABC transporter ATP-binding protein [Clostridium sp. 'deep sea']|uniref:ATP-binding cassette domain-containing protein n=1 Tax=Clostridium sp. 'deep sea' TaxID=2779445 RepID=UPI0018966546|nr:ABC transporter ATP-binding protein [Clostridium sp. 'deep sea']QOR35622.1 ABC transporter ATP-binding protein [Clostridium sp. 'deep sea']